MNTTIKPLSVPENTLLPSFEPLLLAIGDPLRWQILSELSSGQALMVKEIAGKVGRKPTVISKHLLVLRQAGIVVQERRLYRIPSGFIASSDKRHLELGHCLIRLH